MIPELHDEFVALCALPEDERTEEEWALLQVHLAYCDSCRVVFEQCKQLSLHIIPVLAASAHSDAAAKSAPLPFFLEAAERKLMARLDAAPPEEFAPHRRKFAAGPLIGVIAASAIGLASFIGFHWMDSKKQSTPQQLTTSNSGKISRPAIPADTDAELRPKLHLAEREIANLHEQLNTSEEKYRQSTAIATSVQEELKADQTDRKRISDERDALGQQLTSARLEAQSLRHKSLEASNRSAQQVDDAAALEAKLNDLNSMLKEKDRMLALDKDLLAYDRDIRDLIGARDLLILDIQDVGPNGKTEKPGGRMFYTQNKSMVFYGYDLDKQDGLKQSVAFQAWGSGNDKQNVNLGLFYQDDTHKRWVLRFNDPKILSRLNKVFVTAEPRGGSSKPTGKPLLLAYLQAQPNHP